MKKNKKKNKSIPSRISDLFFSTVEEKVKTSLGKNILLSFLLYNWRPIIFFLFPPFDSIKLKIDEMDKHYHISNDNIWYPLMIGILITFIFPFIKTLTFNSNTFFELLTTRYSTKKIEAKQILENFDLFKKIKNENSLEIRKLENEIVELKNAFIETKNNYSKIFGFINKYNKYYNLNLVNKEEFSENLNENEINFLSNFNRFGYTYDNYQYKMEFENLSDIELEIALILTSKKIIQLFEINKNFIAFRLSENGLKIFNSLSIEETI